MKIKELNDEQAIHLAKILLFTSTYMIYEYEFIGIDRVKHDTREGTDSEECISIRFIGKVKSGFESGGWKDQYVTIKIVHFDHYHEYSYFSGLYKDIDSDNHSWRIFWISNHLEASNFLIKNNLIDY